MRAESQENIQKEVVILKKVCLASVFALVVSILAFALYALLFEGAKVYGLWIVVSIVAPTCPIAAKYLRLKQGSKGKALEIAALVLGCFDFYFVIFAATKWNINLAFTVIAVVCVVYAKMFNQVNGEAQESAVKGTTAAEGGDTPIATAGDLDTPKAKKQRYCKYCGGAIDSETKKCTNCGKQYFNIKSAKHIICYALLIAAILSLLCVIYVREQQHEETCKEMENENARLSAIIKNKNIEIDSLETVADQLRDSLYAANVQNSFFDKYVVFVSDDGTNLYHKYGCNDFNTSSFWTYNKAAAIDKGYKQCPECH